MELKVPYDAGDHIAFKCSNRTFMELKAWYGIPEMLLPVF